MLLVGQHAGDFDEPTDGEGTDGVERAVAPAPQSRKDGTDANRELLDLHLEPLGDPHMPELVGSHQQREYPH
jgi:hypothetical protein